MAAPGFWDNPDAAQKVAQEVDGLRDETEGFRKLEQKADDLAILWEMAAEEQDDSYIEEMEETLTAARNELAHLEIGMLLCDEYDKNNAILTLHAVAGGSQRLTLLDDDRFLRGVIARSRCDVSGLNA